MAALLAPALGAPCAAADGRAACRVPPPATTCKAPYGATRAARRCSLAAARCAPERAVTVRSAGSSSETVELPIFPLGLVATPGAEVPLNIFEARYRVLFNTLLAGADDLETDLVDEDSPFKGTRQFGMSLAHSRGVASIGTVLHIEQHARMPDGRMLVSSRGGRRYRIVRVVKERPVLICEVAWLDDEADVMGEDDELTLPELAAELRTLFLNTLSLSNKASGDERKAAEMPDELESLDPQQLSFWLMRVFAQHPGQQQALLEYTSTRDRLKRAQEVLQETLSYLSATSALKSALKDIAAPPEDKA